MINLPARTCECGNQSFVDYNGRNLDACTECAQLIKKDKRLTDNLIAGYRVRRSECEDWHK